MEEIDKDIWYFPNSSNRVEICYTSESIRHPANIQKSEDGETITLTLIYTPEEMSIIKAVLGDNIAFGLLNLCKERYKPEETNETQETSTN